MPYGDPNRFFPQRSTGPSVNDPLRPLERHDTDATLRARVTETPERSTPPPSYPQLRPRPRGAFPSVVQKFERYEELTGSAGTGGTFSEIGKFSGQPDNIDLICTGGDALVQLTDRVGREESSLFLRQNESRKTNISRERVTATNVSDASPATIRATGKWAEPSNGDTE